MVCRGPRPGVRVGIWEDELLTPRIRRSKDDRDAVDHVAPPLGPPDADTGLTLRRFAHRSIREHLVAEHIARNVTRDAWRLKDNGGRSVAGKYQAEAVPHSPCRMGKRCPSSAPPSRSCDYIRVLQRPDDGSSETDVGMEGETFPDLHIHGSGAFVTDAAICG
jgi:hypothetical protein